MTYERVESLCLVAPSLSLRAKRSNLVKNVAKSIYCTALFVAKLAVTHRQGKRHREPGASQTASGRLAKETQ